MSYYVKRTEPETGRVGWVGPIRSAIQVDKEAAAWVSAGWTAETFPSTPEIRAEVRAWEKAKVR